MAGYPPVLMSILRWASDLLLGKSCPTPVAGSASPSGRGVVAGGPHGLSPVIALSSLKKPRLRALLIFQFTGTDW